MKLNMLTATMIASGVALCATSANAAVTKDSHGNVGYDSYDECVAAVKAGDAKFYKPYTYQQPKRLKGEASVKRMKLSEVTIPDSFANNTSLKTKDYSAGACDRGVGQSNGRYGVSGELVGKYVPISPDMSVNVYRDRNGNPVRITMQQCDNHFSSKFPTPVVSEMKAPEAQLNIAEERSVEAVTISERRTVRPTTYHVKEVIVAPSDQVRRIETNTGTKVAIENRRNNAVIVGEEANQRILNRVEQPQEVPVYTVPDADAPRNVTPRVTAPRR